MKIEPLNLLALLSDLTEHVARLEAENAALREQAPRLVDVIGRLMMCGVSGHFDDEAVEEATIREANAILTAHNWEYRKADAPRRGRHEHRDDEPAQENP